MNIYLVGGAVRDKLLGLEVKDKDWLVTGSTPEYFLSQGYEQVGADFPVFLHPETKDEYALARTERKVGAGYNGFETTFDPTVTVEEDLKRRDLTINAIAMDSEGRYVDPYGGVEDLKNKVLKHVSEHFVEDPLRVLRVARFMARYGDLGFTVHPDTMALMKQIGLNGELSHLTSERVFKELEKVFTEPNPSYFFQVLKDSDTLQFIFPEIDDLFGIPQPEAHHPEIDTGVHVLMVLDQAKKIAPNNFAVLFAVLTHDLGKGITPKAMLPQHIGHEASGVKLVTHLCERLKVPSYVKKLAEFTCEYHTRCHTALSLKEKTIYDLFKSADAFRNPQLLKDFLLACEADARGRTGFENRDYPQAQFLDFIFEKSKNVDIQSIMGQGYKNREIAEQVELHRIRNIFKSRAMHPLFLEDKANDWKEVILNPTQQKPDVIFSCLKSLKVEQDTELLTACMTFLNCTNNKFVQMAEKFSEIKGQTYLDKGLKGMEVGLAMNKDKLAIINEYLQHKPSLKIR